MLLRLAISVLLGLGCASILAKSLLSYTDPDDDPCAPFTGRLDNVCLWYRSENVVFICKTQRFLPTDGADLVVLQADGEIQKICDFWTERPGTVRDDPLWGSSDSSSSSDDDDDDDDVLHRTDEVKPKVQARSPQWTPMYGGDYHRIPTDTRCNPKNTSQVQVFRHGWYPAYDCPKEHSCIDISRTNMPGRAGCDNVDGTYDIPDPHEYEPDLKKRTVLDPAADDPIRYDSRCSPSNQRIIQLFVGGTWIDDYTCPLSTPCLDLHGLATCELGAGIYYIPSAEASSSISKTRRDTPPWKVLHSWDTRCNPSNMSEVQRFDGNNWVLHAVCPIKLGCKDVNGIGACYLGNNHYDLPAANDTMDPDNPLPPAPFLMQQRCNDQNPREIMIRTMDGWVTNSYCIDPYVCEDFLDASFAICVDPEVGQTTDRVVYKPWAHSSGVASAGGLDIATLRCRSDDELVRLNGTKWVHDSYCTHGWKCRNDENKPHVGGCQTRFMLPMEKPTGSDHIHARGADTEESHPSPNAPPHNHDTTSGTSSSDSDNEATKHGHFRARSPDIEESRSSANAPPSHDTTTDDSGSDSDKGVTQPRHILARNADARVDPPSASFTHRPNEVETDDTDSDSDNDAPKPTTIRGRNVEAASDLPSPDSAPGISSTIADGSGSDSDSADENVEQILESGAGGGMDEIPPMLRQPKYRGMHERRVGVRNPNIEPHH